MMANTELAHDEAYYWLWSRYPDWGYFDHPPLIAWLIGLTAGWIPGEWGVRLGPFCTLIAAAWVVGRSLIAEDRQWAWWAGWLIFPLLSFTPSFALPDTALLASTLVFFWALHTYIVRDSISRAIGVGIAAALLLYSKYHGVLLIAGAVVGAPELLKRRSFWLALLTGGSVLVPHALWQWRHNFVTFEYHLFQAHHGGLSLQRPIELLVQQLFIPGIFLAPWVWWKALKHWRFDSFQRSLAGMAAMTLGVLFCLSFFKSVEGNWTVAGYLALLVMVLRSPVDWLRQGRLFTVLGACSVIFVIAVKLFIIVDGSEKIVPRLEEIRGWQAWSQALARATPDCVLVANRHQIAAKLSFYLNRRVTSVKDSRPNQFDIWGWERELGGVPVCWITSNNHYPSQEWRTPEGKTLYLVRGLTMDQLLR
ncbi:MAG: ArnT family glycosyltransferase [Deltaproteobacteria bacterium]